MRKRENATMREKSERSAKAMRNQAIRFLLFVFASGTILASAGFAQQAEEQKGLDQGNYNIKQTIEFGGRFDNISGNIQTYDTMVNLQGGPRLFDFSTEIRSLDHHGTLFDRLYFSNTGYGGDPNNVSRLRISKNKVYAFEGMFRRDENMWDYSLLANPLNPGTTVPNAPANFNPIKGQPTVGASTPIIAISPHYFDTRRNLHNYGVTILPDAKIRLRLGYVRNTNLGPGFSTIHQGTEQFLLQDYSTTVNQYRIGLDFRFLPRTNISYDQIWNYYKSDTSSTDQNQQFIPTGGTLPVDLGVSWNPTANQPCKNTFAAGGATVSNVCSAYYSYYQQSRVRVNSPTEQLSFQSNYWKSLDLSGKVSYTAGDMKATPVENFAGLESRTALTNYNASGLVGGRHVATYADFGATWHATGWLNIVDSFHWGNWREPAQYGNTQCSFFSSNLVVPANNLNSPLNSCVPPAGSPAGLPGHSASSGADLLLNLDSNFLKQDEKTNLIAAQIQISPIAGATFGYRLRDRAIVDNFYNTQSGLYQPGPTAVLAARGSCARLDPTQPVGQGNLPTGCILNVDGSISYASPTGPAGAPGETDIHEKAAVLGFWLRPTPRLKVSFDTDLGTGTQAFTRISPVQTQEYRLRATYKATDWLTFNGAITAWNGQNNVPTVENLQHNRSYAISFLFAPNEKFSADLGYDFGDVYSRVLICYVGSGAATGLSACPGVAGLIQQLSSYVNKSHTGFMDFTYTPVRKVTVRFGANLVSNYGTALRLDPQNLIPTAVPGPLNSMWYHPYGGVDYKFAKQWTGRAFWDYYGYHEDASGAYQDQFSAALRNFRGNLVTLTLRYAF